MLAAADRACQIVLYDARSKLVHQHTLRGHTTFRADNLLFDPSGKTLISSGFDNTVRMWSVATGRQVGIVNGKQFSLGAFVHSTIQGQHLLAEFHADTLIGNRIDTPDLDVVWQRRGKE
jgi:WD40 repeat protein